MTNNTLTIEVLNLNTRQNETITLKASNYYILVYKYEKLNLRYLDITSYHLENSKIEAGNEGINSEAYLREILQEVTGEVLR